MTYDWIAKRRELEQAATEGPWRAALLDGVDYEDGSSSYRGGIYPGQLPGPAPLFVTNSIDAHNAALIADARTSLPKALDALEAVLERARMEQDDAESAMTYAAEINDGLTLAGQQARKQAWADAARVITTALEAS